MAFMSATDVPIDGIDCHIRRSGYTGEDGYEISVPGRRMRRSSGDTLLADPG